MHGPGWGWANLGPHEPTATATAPFNQGQPYFRVQMYLPAAGNPHQFSPPPATHE